jgi:hypothetical protein
LLVSKVQGGTITLAEIPRNLKEHRLDQYSSPRSGIQTNFQAVVIEPSGKVEML